MKNKIAIRPARETDLEIISDFFHELIKSHTQYDRLFQIQPQGADVIKKFVSETFTSKEAFIYVATDTKNVVGYVLGRLKEHFPVLVILKIFGSLSSPPVLLSATPYMALFESTTIL